MVVGWVLFVILSEGELEEVLTTYTKLNKSASIFLGSKSKSPPVGSSPANTGISLLGTHSDSTLVKHKDTVDGITTWDDVPRGRVKCDEAIYAIEQNILIGRWAG